MPQVFATLNVVNAAGERDNLPLEIEPVQVPRVRYYLVFRALLPNRPRVAGPFAVANLPAGTVDVYVTGIDDGSDQPIAIHQQVELPRGAKPGHFVDAVQLDNAGRIVGVLPEKLSWIR